MPLPWTDLIFLALLGLAAGSFGGLLGIGGSVIMIPGLTVVLGYNYHLAQAAAMVVNFFVAAPSLLRHHRAKAVEWSLFSKMLPFALAAILLGVFLSNRLEGRWLELVFGLFLLYVVFVNVRKLLGDAPEPAAGDARLGWIPAGSIGSIMGFAAGLLGIGGGAIAVPLFQKIANLPLRRCIATSAAVMCITALPGAVTKNLTLHAIPADPDLALRPEVSLSIAALLIPTAILGGYLGAGLTHRLPLRIVRAIFVLLLLLTSARMIGVF